ncbi:DUF6493 family protein [Hymenobacter aerophilus]|uniref:DUF6493 family protein n=1 Tax=Hymenobacter aerophilus TaxID=119644 RepID=UPI0012FBBF5D|nr:DUF6493 family protein [Hymenobacter aerophilus]
MANSTENFEQLVRHRPLPELLDFLVQLDKQDLVAVRLKTKALCKEMNDWRNDTPESRALMQREAHLLLAGLATYTKQEALGRSFELPAHLGLDNDKDNRGYKEYFMRVLRHSRPSWLKDWLVRQARAEFGYILPYSQLREMETAGLLGHDPWLFAQSLAQRPSYYSRTNKERGQGLATFMLAQLQADTTLLARDLPLLFDYDTNVDSASAYLGAKLKSVSWLTLLPALTESGHLDRATLLTSSLLALRRDFRRPLLSWFKDLFLALEPTPDERLARQAELRELLAQPLTQVVNFALDQLKLIWGEPGFDVDALLPYADELLTRSNLKTGLKTLFSGFDKLLKARPALAPALTPRLATALAHPDAGVQERAAKSLAGLLGAKKPLLDEEALANTIADVQGLSELLSTPARTLLAPWLVAAPAALVPLEAYRPHTGYVPDISAATAIAPVADWHELLFLTGQALQPDQPAEQERWLDGLLRLRAQYPTDYAAQLRPYLLQVFSGYLRDKTEAETTDILRKMDYGRAGQRDFLRALLAGWYGGFAQPQVARTSLAAHYQLYPDPLLSLARQRLVATEARLAPGAVPLPLLSTPTHQPFWVAPMALLDKLLAYEAAGQEPDATDSVLALSRLAWNAPADAATARQRLAGLANADLRQLLSWLLAPAEETPALPVLRPGDKSLFEKAASRFGQWVSGEHPVAPTLAEVVPWLWAVAARTRYPQAALPELTALANYPGLAEPWQPSWRINTETHTVKQSYNKAEPEYVYQTHELVVPTAEAAAPPSPLLLYSLHAQLPQKKHTYIWSLFEDLSFLHSLLPNNPASLQWHLLRSAFTTSEGYSEEQSGLSKQLHALLNDGPAYEEPATVLLAVGLLYGKSTVRALAWEVLLAAVGTGRLVPVALGNALGRLLAGSYAPVLRLAEALPAARGISLATDDALRQLLEALLPELPAAPLRNTAKLLAAYTDLRAGAGLPLPAAVQERLQEWQAVGSLKKAATVLLDI